MASKIEFYKGKVALNVLAKDAKNGKAVFDAGDGCVAVGVLSSMFNNAEEGITYVEDFTKSVPIVSVGLGSGDPNQWEKAALIAAATKSAHVNQVFTGAPVAKGMLINAGATNTTVNSLVSPTGIVGKVKISTGPLSSTCDGIVDVKTAVLMIKDMKVDAVKFFPMGGLASIDELKEVAKHCAQNGIMLEPTGGVDLDNFKEILNVCLAAGVERIMVHVYNSIIDKSTGETRPQDVKALFDIVKSVL